MSSDILDSSFQVQAAVASSEKKDQVGLGAGCCDILLVTRQTCVLSH